MRKDIASSILSIALACFTAVPARAGDGAKGGGDAFVCGRSVSLVDSHGIDEKEINPRLRKAASKSVEEGLSFIVSTMKVLVPVEGAALEELLSRITWVPVKSVEELPDDIVAPRWLRQAAAGRAGSRRTS